MVTGRYLTLTYYQKPSSSHSTVITAFAANVSFLCLTLYFLTLMLYVQGVTCYEMATGYPPYHTVHPLKLITLIPRQKPPALPEGYSADFNDFVSRCLVKDPQQRPAIKDLLKLPFVQSAGKLSELSQA